jgi:hypothetical protein
MFATFQPSERRLAASFKHLTLPKVHCHPTRMAIIHRRSGELAFTALILSHPFIQTIFRLFCGKISIPLPAFPFSSFQNPCPSVSIRGSTNSNLFAQPDLAPRPFFRDSQVSH